MTGCSPPPVRAIGNVAASDRFPGGRGPKGSGPWPLNPRAPHEVARRSTKWRGQDSNLRTQRGRIYSPVRLTASLPRREGGECSDVASNGRPGSTSYRAYFGPPTAIAV